MEANTPLLKSKKSQKALIWHRRRRYVAHNCIRELYVYSKSPGLLPLLNTHSTHLPVNNLVIFIYIFDYYIYSESPGARTHTHEWEWSSFANY